MHTSIKLLRKLITEEIKGLLSESSFESLSDVVKRFGKPPVEHSETWSYSENEEYAFAAKSERDKPEYFIKKANPQYWLPMKYYY